MKKIYKSLVINPVSEEKVEIYNPGYLVVCEGKILSLTNKDPSSDYKGSELVNFENKIILPGLIDTHLHLPQYSFLGKGTDLELLEWLETLTFPSEARFSDPEYARNITEKFFDDLIAHGTTTASIYTTIHEQATDIAFSMADKKGMRAFIGKVMMDQNSPEELLENTEESLKASIRLFKKWDNYDNGRLRYIFTPRFAPTCSMELMRGVGKFIKENNAYAQTHLSENLNEIKLVGDLFPKSSDYTDVYNSAGLTGKKVIMAHCIHLTNKEIRILAETGTKIAHSPYSNENLKNGVMPYMKMKKAGITVGLGSDIAGGPSISMFEQMKQAIKASEKAIKTYEDINQTMSPSEALYLATLGGANVLGIADITGNLSKDKEADFIVINSEKIKTNSEDIISSIIELGKDMEVEKTFVRGKGFSRK